MRDAGASFVVHKASQGDYHDPSFLKNFQASYGFLPRSTYHFFDNDYAPNVQAKTYWDAIQKVGFMKWGTHEGMFWWDLEDRKVAKYYYWGYWYDVIEEFKRLSGIPSNRIGIYSGYYYLMENLRFASSMQKRYFKQYKYWPADYQSDPLHPNFSEIRIPEPWTDDDVVMIQTGTPALGLRRGVYSKDIDYDITNKKNFEIMFPEWKRSDIRIRIGVKA
jgi:hypothetical protein